MAAPSWQDRYGHCARSEDGKHHWSKFKSSHIRGMPKFTEVMGRKVLNYVVILVTCRYCLFTTKAVMDFENREVRMNQ
jgi:hypothetical protein